MLFAKKTIMETDRTEVDYAAFERAMDEERIYAGVQDFEGICSAIGADPVSLDRMIYDEIGLRGQALVDFYLRSEDIH